MSDQILFDRLRYIDKLKSSGISDEHARAHADAIDNALRESVATRSDITALTALQAATSADIARLETKIELAIRDLTIRMGIAALAIVGALATIKFFG